MALPNTGFVPTSATGKPPTSQGTKRVSLVKLQPGTQNVPTAEKVSPLAQQFQTSRDLPSTIGAQTAMQGNPSVPGTTTATSGQQQTRMPDLPPFQRTAAYNGLEPLDAIRLVVDEFRIKRAADRWDLRLSGIQGFVQDWIEKRAEDYEDEDSEEEPAEEPFHHEAVKFLLDNPDPDDQAVHDYAEEHGWDIDEFETKIYRLASKLVNNLLAEGTAAKKGITVSDVDPEEFRKGVAVEMEHTNCPILAGRIALDHLAEQPDFKYYTELKKMEGES